MSPQDRAIQAFLANPSAESLPPLLRAVGDSVYNLSFQILRRREDAEDAAQEVLLEIARDGSQIREGRAFRRWLYKVCLNTALDHLRARRRRVEAESAKTPGTPPLPVNGDALFEALAKLDDGDRTLLVEHYFEVVSLTDMAAREGCSKVAVWKRIEKARSRLKRILGATGLGLAALLLATPAAAAPPGLVPKSVDKALLALEGLTTDLVTSSLTVKAALAGIGGAIMGTKAVISGTTLAVALVFLTIGAGSGYLVGAKRSSGPPSSTSGPGTAIDAGNSRSPELAKTPGHQSETTSAGVDPGTGPESPKEGNPLGARLDRFKAWLKEFDAKRQKQSPQDMERRLLMLKDELEGVRELILADPAEFLAWIGQRENGPFVGDLMDATIAEKPSLYAIKSHEFSSFPASLTDGLLVLLQSGDAAQRQAIIAFARFLRNPPESYRSQFVTMLSDPDIFVGPQAAQALLSTPEPTAAEVEAVVRYAERLENDVSRQLVVQGLGRVPRPETREWLLQALESDRFPDPRGRLAWAALEWWIDPGRSPGAAFEDRAARILASAMRRTTDSDGYFMSLYTALNLPIAKSLPLIEQAAMGAPSEKLRKAATTVLQKARVEGAGARILQETLISANSEK